MSDISSLINITSGAVNNILDSTAASGKINKSSDSQTFDGIFNAAVNMVSNTNQYLQEAQKAEVAFAMGELTTHFTEEFKAEYPDAIDWRNFKQLRNICAHRYGILDFRLIWEIATAEIPDVKRFFEGITE